MGSIKSSQKKARLSKAARSSKPVPIFVRLKTAKRVSSTPARRHWRSQKLRAREKE